MDLDDLKSSGDLVGLKWLVPNLSMSIDDESSCNSLDTSSLLWSTHLKPLILSSDYLY